MSNELPLGVHFYPRDEELIECLRIKARGDLSPTGLVVDKKVYEKDPWEIFTDSDHWERVPGDTGKRGIKMVTYAFTQLPQSKTKNKPRTAGHGTWSADTGPKDIKDKSSQIIGCKRTFKFVVKGKDLDQCGKEYGGWTMHEYSLNGVSGNSVFVVCKIIRKLDSSCDSNTNLPDILGPAHDVLGKRRSPFEDRTSKSTKVLRIDKACDSAVNWPRGEGSNFHHLPDGGSEFHKCTQESVVDNIEDDALRVRPIRENCDFLHGLEDDNISFALQLEYELEQEEAHDLPVKQNGGQETLTSDGEGMRYTLTKNVTAERETVNVSHIPVHDSNDIVAINNTYGDIHLNSLDSLQLDNLGGLLEGLPDSSIQLESKLCDGLAPVSDDWIEDGLRSCCFWTLHKNAAYGGGIQERMS